MVTLSGMEIDANEVQPEKALLAMEVTPSGMMTEDREVQSLKA